MNTSAEYAQRLSRALGFLGVQTASLDELARMFPQMAKNTGEQGEAGFMKVTRVIAALGTEQERVTELTRVFGQQGAALAPLMRAGPEAFERALESTMDVMFSVSDLGVAAGDKMATGYQLAADGVKTLFQDVVGSSAALLEGTFGTEFPIIVLEARNIIGRKMVDC